MSGAVCLKDIAADTVKIITRGEYTNSNGEKVKLDKNGLRASGAMHRNDEYGALTKEAGPWDASEDPGLLPQVVVFAGDSLDAAFWAVQSSNVPSTPLVLDFASDSNPGGGWRGNQRGTQEESLCRRSNLGVALENMPAAYPIPHHGVAYVPKVYVFRANESQKYTLLDVPFTVSVAASALRGVGGDADTPLDPKQTTFVKDKVNNILNIAKHYGHSQVVLGAWGCGAFGNPVKNIAQIFRQEVCKSHPVIKQVIFAIPKGDNLAVFQQVFNDAQHVSLNSSTTDSPADEVFECAKWELLSTIQKEDVLAGILQAKPPSPPNTQTELKILCKGLAEETLKECIQVLSQTYPVTADALLAVDLESVVSTKCQLSELLCEVQQQVREVVTSHAKTAGWFAAAKKEK